MVLPHSTWVDAGDDDDDDDDGDGDDDDDDDCKRPGWTEQFLHPVLVGY